MTESVDSPKSPPAFVQVVRGDVPRKLSFASAQPARMVIGSAPQADLRLMRADVAPRQLDAVWDGQHLWLQDALRLGRTFVNGHLLNEWVPVVHACIVSFADVRLWMVGSRKPPAMATPDFLAFERKRLSHGLASSASRRHQTGRLTIPPELRRLLSGANDR